MLWDPDKTMGVAEASGMGGGVRGWSCVLCMSRTEWAFLDALCISIWLSWLERDKYGDIDAREDLSRYLVTHRCFPQTHDGPTILHVPGNALVTG